MAESKTSFWSLRDDESETNWEVGEYPKWRINETQKVSQVRYQLGAAKMMNQPTVLEFLNEGHSIDVDTSEHR